MRAARISIVLFICAAGLALVACAANSAGSGGNSGYVVPIEVENNLSGLSGASIYIARSSGTGRRLLGPVESGQKKTFEYDARNGTYRLTARPQGVGQDSIVSDVFQLQPGMVVQWSIPTNRLLTGTR